MGKGGPSGMAEVEEVGGGGVLGLGEVVLKAWHPVPRMENVRETKMDAQPRGKESGTIVNKKSILYLLYVCVRSEVADGCNSASKKRREILAVVPGVRCRRHGDVTNVINEAHKDVRLT